MGSFLSGGGDQAIKSITVIIAMEAEAMPIVERLGLTKEENFFPPFSPSHSFIGSENNVKVRIVTNGKDSQHEVDNVGTVPAATTALLALQKDRPDILINAGTAGGFVRKTAAIGDVFVSTAFKNHDRRIVIPGTKFEEYGVGDYPSHPVQAMLKDLGYKSGVVTTGNSLDHEPKDDEVMLANDASVKEMEAAGIAWVARMFGVPFFAIKVVTDLVDGGRPSHEEFMENLQTAAQKLQETVPDVIKYCAEKNAQEL